MRKIQRGEIATIVTIGSLVFILIATIASTFFFKKPQTTSTKAAGTCSSPNSCNYSSMCICGTTSDTGCTSPKLCCKSCSPTATPILCNGTCDSHPCNSVNACGAGHCNTGYCCKYCNPGPTFTPKPPTSTPVPLVCTGCSSYGNCSAWEGCRLESDGWHEYRNCYCTAKTPAGCTGNVDPDLQRQDCNPTNPTSTPGPNDPTNTPVPTATPIPGTYIKMQICHITVDTGSPLPYTCYPTSLFYESVSHVQETDNTRTCEQNLKEVDPSGTVQTCFNDINSCMSACCRKVYKCNNDGTCSQTSSGYYSTSFLECVGDFTRSCSGNLAQITPAVNNQSCYSTEAECLSACSGSAPTNTPTPTKTPTPTPTGTITPTPTPTGGPTNTPVPGCLCSSGGTCATVCAFEKFAAPITYTDPIKCSLSPLLFATAATPSVSNKNSWCQATKRTKGDANGDGVVDDTDYYLYVGAANGGQIPPTANPDFNGDGEVGASDRVIIMKILKP